MWDKKCSYCLWNGGKPQEFKYKSKNKNEIKNVLGKQLVYISLLIFFFYLYLYPPDSKCSSLFSKTLHLEFALTWYNSALFFICQLWAILIYLIDWPLGAFCLFHFYENVDESFWTLTQVCDVSAVKYQLNEQERRKNTKFSAIMHFAAGCHRELLENPSTDRQFNCQTWSESLLIQQVYQGLSIFPHANMRFGRGISIWRTTFLTGAVNLTTLQLPPPCYRSSIFPLGGIIIIFHIITLTVIIKLCGCAFFHFLERKL